MLTRTKRRVFFWLSVIIFLCLVPVAILYSLGYRLSPDFKLEKTGGLYISSPLSGSEIFLKGELQKRTNLLQQGIFIESLAPGAYEIVVAKEGYLSWSKELRVYSQLVSEARALLIPTEPNASIILKTLFSHIKASPLDPLFILTEARKNQNIFTWYLPEINQFLIPDPSAAGLAFRKSFEILKWQQGGAVLSLDDKAYRVNFNFNDNAVSASPLGASDLADILKERDNVLERVDLRGVSKLLWDPTQGELSVNWLADSPPPYFLSERKEVLLKNKTVRNFEFFPGRKDAAIVAYENGIWAVEFDSRGKRNKMPIYKGSGPDFALVAGSTSGIYILDNGFLIRASFFAKE